MIGTVIVPLDGSDLAELAIPYAEAIARRSGAPIHLLRVVPTQREATAEEEARRYLETAAGQLVDGERVQISVRVGDPAEEIAEAAAEQAAPLIVMTTHGRSGLSRWWYGSVADKVVRSGAAPVFLLRSAEVQPKGPEIHSILVPLDGSPYSEAALPYATEMARTFDAEIHLVRVAETAQLYGMLGPGTMTPPATDTLNEIAQQLVRDAQEYLARVEERLRGEGLRVSSDTLEGIPGEQILAYERERAVDLVVMATHGRTGLSRVVFGSVAERVLKSGSEPVLMVHPERPEQEGEREERGSA